MWRSADLMYRIDISQRYGAGCILRKPAEAACRALASGHNPVAPRATSLHAQVPRLPWTAGRRARGLPARPGTASAAKRCAMRGGLPGSDREFPSGTAASSSRTGGAAGSLVSQRESSTIRSLPFRGRNMMSNKPHLRPHQEKRQASQVTRLLVAILIITVFRPRNCPRGHRAHRIPRKVKPVKRCTCGVPGLDNCRTCAVRPNRKRFILVD
jgi:hypothetical protein